MYARYNPARTVTGDAMAIACVRIPHYALRIATSQREVPDGTPMILRGESNGQLVVLDVTVEATRLGVRVGQQIREARALAPLALVISPDPVRETMVAHEIMTSFLQRSPLAMPDNHEPGCWYIDLVGLDRHFGSAEDAARHLLACAPDHLRPRVAVAPTMFAARVAAGVTRASQVLVIDHQQVRPFLDGASINWLPLAPQVIRDLQNVGIVTLGDLSHLTVGQVSARFGPDGVLAWEIANGIDRRQIVAPAQEPSVVISQAMPEATVSRDLLLLHLGQMVKRAFRDDSLQGRFAREVVIQAMYEQGGSWVRRLSFKTALDRDHMLTALKLRLQDVEIAGSISVVSLRVTGIVSEGARQQAISALKPKATASLQEVAEQLRQRYGTPSLYRIVEVERWSRHPERQYALASFDP